MPGKLVQLAAALLLALGLGAAGWFVAGGLVDLRRGDRYVVVKGLAERPVEADLAIWPLRFVATGDDLATVQAKLAADGTTVRRFLAGNGFADASVSLQSLEVTDLLAQPYRSGPTESRFILAQTLLVRTEEVERVAAAAQKVGDLVDGGVVLSGEGGSAGGPTYLFTRLGDFKPPLLSEAIADARAGAERFAEASGSRIGGIRQAQQGLFQILPADDYPGAYEAKQIGKRLRVVSTVEFRLVD